MAYPLKDWLYFPTIKIRPVVHENESPVTTKLYICPADQKSNKIKNRKIVCCHRGSNPRSPSPETRIKTFRPHLRK